MGTVLATAIAIVLVASAVAWAKTASGHQNPDLLVTVRLTPNHPAAGDTVRAQATITNETGRTLKVTASTEFDTPTTGQGVDAFGKVAPGKSWTFPFHRAVPKGGAGSYRLTASAKDEKGSSHAAVRVTISS